MEAWAAGLIGALIGGASSFAGIWMQSRYQHRREIAKMVMEAAAKDRSEQIELGMKLGQVGKIAPVALFVHYHAKLFELVGSGKLTQENLSKLHKENQEMSELMHRMHDQEMRRQ